MLRLLYESNKARICVTGGEMVHAEDVISIYQSLLDNGIQVWLTGGWGIDALLGEQTRPHKDLDVIVLLDDVVRMRELLGRDGYRLKMLWSENRWDVDAHGVETATAFVLQDSEGREFDAHAMRLDDQSNGIPAWAEAEEFVFTRQDLAGEGTIAGVAFQCLTPEMQMLCHTGYALPDEHLRDLERLHQMYGVDYPKQLDKGPS
jgi:lincosamide nucleotidyltransferase A/C/D/E